ncbi:MAG: hypothetical protein IJC58_06465 [Oscillospiraceae bacterium]|nr:hypothetical protein [Oscillospiraceae bacterium]
MENTTFKNSLFGGFNRQDVIDYIESASRKSSETIAALEAEVASLQDERAALTEERDSLSAELDALKAQLSALTEERDSLACSLGEAKSLGESFAAGLEEANASLAAANEELSLLRPQAEEYAKVKEHISGIELDAKRRADEAESSVRTRLNVFLSEVQKQYASLVSSTNTAVTHASSELRKLEVTLSQLPLAFDAGKTELEKLEKSVYSNEE